jgi:hypothetical protein
MDAYGKNALALILIVFFAAAFGLRFMANHTPRWTVFATALVVLALSFCINSGHSRELAGVVGLLRIIGLFGITYGITVLRKKAK